MKVVGLISGGKDSCYNMMQCIAVGHEIVALANLKPADKDELDSYMYQTVGHQGIELFAEAMELPLFRREIQGQAISQGKDYSPQDSDEVEDLYELLKTVKEEIPIEAVSVGAILSDYQRVRVENVCSRLNLTPLAYLWRCDQKNLLQNMIDCGVEAIIIKVATLGLTPQEHLGKSISQLQEYLLLMEEKYGINVCGEGGEYETFTTNCPLFKKKIVIDEMEAIIESDDTIAPVGYLRFNKMHTEDKNGKFYSSMELAIKDIPILHSQYFLDEINIMEYIHCTQPIRTSTGAKNTIYEKAILKFDGDPRVNFSTKGLVFVSGIEGRREFVDQSISEITVKVMSKLKECLESQDIQMDDIIMICLYLKHIEDFASVNEVYKNFFSINPPARVCVEAPLPLDRVIYLECIACQLSSDMYRISTMHVQSISHWAPANIGPYSQAKKVKDLIFIAGQIGLTPSTMTIVEGGIKQQCYLSLRHATRILQAMSCECGLRNVILGVCFVVNVEYIKYAETCWKEAVMKEKISASDNLFRMMSYVVVPGLPKNALVEWQILAEDIMKYRWSCKTLKYRYETYGLESFHCIDKLRIFSTIIISVESFVGNKLNEDQVNSNLFRHLTSILGESDQSVLSICYVKVFYKFTCPDQILEDILDTLSNTAVQLFPVIDFANPCLVLIAQFIAAG